MGFPPPSGGGVASVFTRTGAVTAAAGDYTAIASGSVGIANFALASASSIAITGPGTYFITGTTSIDIVNGAARGCVITLVASGQAAGVCVILNNATTANALSLRDNANLGIYAGESVTLVYNGTYWLEAARALKTVLSYVEFTSTVNITATTEATANTIVSAAAITFDNATPIKIEAFWPNQQVAASSDLNICLYDGAASIGRNAYGSNNGMLFGFAGFNAQRRAVISNASHTFSWRGYTSSGTPSAQVGAGGTATLMPGYIKISRDL